jgi:hypothetical protein
VTRTTYRLGVAADAVGLGSKALIQMNHRYGLEMGHVPPGGVRRRFAKRDLWALNLLADLVLLGVGQREAVQIANQADKKLIKAWGHVGDSDLLGELRLCRPLLAVNPGAHPSDQVTYVPQAGAFVADLVDRQISPVQLLVDLEALWIRVELVEGRLRGTTAENDDDD